MSAAKSNLNNYWTDFHELATNRLSVCDFISRSQSGDPRSTMEPYGAIQLKYGIAANSNLGNYWTDFHGLATNRLSVCDFISRSELGDPRSTMEPYGAI